MSKVCEDFLNNPEINPKTGRKIKIGAATYLKLQKECNPEAVVPKKVTKVTKVTKSPKSADSVCKDFLNDTTRNPRTNRIISPTGKVYRDLMKECQPLLTVKASPKKPNTKKENTKPNNSSQKTNDPNDARSIILDPQIHVETLLQQKPKIRDLVGENVSIYNQNTITNLDLFDKSKITFVPSKAGPKDFEEAPRDEGKYKGELIQKNDKHFELVKDCIEDEQILEKHLTDNSFQKSMLRLAEYCALHNVNYYNSAVGDFFNDEFNHPSQWYEYVRYNLTETENSPSLYSYNLLKRVLLKYRKLGNILSSTFWKTFGSAGIASFDIIIWYQHKELNHPCAIKFTENWEKYSENIIKDWILSGNQVDYEYLDNTFNLDFEPEPYYDLKKNIESWIKKKNKLIEKGFKANKYYVDTEFDFEKFPLVYKSSTFNLSKKTNPLYRKLQIEYLIRFYAFYCYKKNRKYKDNYVFGFENDFSLLKTYRLLKLNYEDYRLVNKNFDLSKNFGLCMYFIKDLPFWQKEQPTIALRIATELFAYFNIDVRKFFA